MSNSTFQVIFSSVSIMIVTFLNVINRNNFTREEWCVLCDVRTKLLYIIEISFIFYRVKYVTQECGPLILRINMTLFLKFCYYCNWCIVWGFLVSQGCLCLVVSRTATHMKAGFVCQSIAGVNHNVMKIYWEILFDNT